MAADEVIVQELAAKMGIEGPILVNLKTDTYPDTKHFSYRRFSVQGDQTDISLLLKKAQTDPVVRQTTSLKSKLLNEITFYSQVIPRMRPILEKMRECENTVHSLFVPNYYGHDATEGKEWLAIEDVSTEYKSLPDPENLDKEFLKASVQALAAFHSASITWKASSPIEYHAVAKLFCETEMMRPDEVDPTVDIKTQKMNAALSAAAKACSVHLTGPYAISLEKVFHAANFEAPFWVSMERSEPWSVITHGDCWAKNFLYKYDKSKKITGVAIVDFKCSRAGSPVLDVTNFLLSSASPDCLKDLRPFIEKHKDSMSPKIPDYRSHVHQFGPYGIIAALVHHFYCVLYPSLDVADATRLIENPELAEAYEVEMNKDAKKSAGSAGKDSPAKETVAAREKRVALVVKAAHDVRII